MMMYVTLKTHYCQAWVQIPKPLSQQASDHCIWRARINHLCKSGLDPIDCKSSFEYFFTNTTPTWLTPHLWYCSSWHWNTHKRSRVLYHLKVSTCISNPPSFQVPESAKHLSRSFSLAASNFCLTSVTLRSHTLEPLNKWTYDHFYSIFLSYFDQLCNTLFQIFLFWSCSDHQSDCFVGGNKPLYQVKDF